MTALWRALRRGLFANPLDGLITIALLLLLGHGIRALVHWAVHQAQWTVIKANSTLLALGRYPEPDRWRLWLVLALLCSASGLSWGLLRGPGWPRPDRISATALSLLAGLLPLALDLEPRVRWSWLALAALLLIWRWAVGHCRPALPPWLLRCWPLIWPLVYLLGMALIAGCPGLKPVPPTLWGGLLLTLVEACFAWLMCFPLGVLLALCRRSDLPLLRWGAVVYIELIRGAPLITLLFLGQNMLGFVLPGGLSPDRVWRAAWVLTLFAAAYVAEAVRAGLASVPRGQIEAARALGLNPLQTQARVVLPQALKVALPSLVGQFITLFQDTTLLSLIGLMDLLGTARSVLANPQFLGRNAEVYLVLAVLFWSCCTALALGSRALERRLRHEPSATQP